MAQVLIRNLDARTLEVLKRRARVHNRSLQQELRTILVEASRTPPIDYVAAARRVRERLKKLGVDFEDSAESQREDRLR